MENQAMLEPGYVVTLRSGGPIMTVSQIQEFSGVQFARCLYFTEEGKLESVCIPEKALIYYDDLEEGAPEEEECPEEEES